jgi:Acetyltransferase (GNAT) domain
MIIPPLLCEQDYAIKEMPSSILHLLKTANLPWLNSLDFCVGFDADTRAERIFVRTDFDKVYQAVFYRLVNKTPFLRIVEIIGFPNIAEHEIQGLIVKHKAQLALVNRLEPPVKPNERWHSEKANLFLHNYIPIAHLPNCKHAYFNQLGKHKRVQLPKYWQQLTTHLDNDLEIRCEVGEDIKLEETIQLECLNRTRRAAKGKGVDSIANIEKRHKNLQDLTKTSGFFMTLRHRGIIVGGTLSFISGNEAFIMVLAHDLAYEQFRAGTLSIWKTLECLIERNITNVNFLWGRQVFKSQFLGVEHPWCIHIITKYQGLALFWKIQLKIHAFMSRAWRFLRTKMEQLAPIPSIGEYQMAK